MNRGVLELAALALFAAAGDEPDPLDRLVKRAGRLEAGARMSKEKEWREEDRAALADLCEQALDLAIDLKHGKRGFDAYFFVLECLHSLEPEVGERFFTEAMDGLIDSYLHDDRLASVLLTVLAMPPPHLVEPARGYVDWIGRDSKSPSVHCAFRFKKLAAEAAVAVDVEQCRALIAAFEELDRDCGDRPGRYAWESWSQMLSEEREALHLVGKPAREIAGPDLDGVEFRLSDYRGKVVLLDFWGLWCPPCRGLLPRQRELVERTKDAPFVLVGVNSDADYDKARKSWPDESVPWRSFADERLLPGSRQPVKISDEWKVKGWPTLFLIDHRGVIRHRWIGPPPAGALEQAVDALVVEAGAAATPQR